MSLPDDADGARLWSRQHPVEALRYLTSAGEVAVRDDVLESVCLELVEFDPEGAVEIADRMAPNGINLLENLVQRWAERDATAAAAFASGKNPGELRDRLFSRIAFAESKRDPVSAACLVTDQIATGSVQMEAAISVLHQWYLQNPSAARAWAQSFPLGEARNRALHEVGLSLPR